MTTNVNCGCNCQVLIAPYKFSLYPVVFLIVSHKQKHMIKKSVKSKQADTVLDHLFCRKVIDCIYVF